MDIGSLIAGAVIGSIPSWFIAKLFYDKSSKDLEAGLNKHASQIESSNTFNYFERMLRTSEWRKEHINHDEVWVCERDNTLQIHKADDHREFHETWANVFPDQNISMFHIELKMNETIIKSLPFISADGGRYTLPLPELAVVDDSPCFFWALNSVEVKVAEIIGNFYRYSTIQEVAAFAKIELHSVANHA